MKSKPLFSTLCLSVSLLAGCAFADMKVNIQPELTDSVTTASTTVQELPVALKVMDERPQQIIGHRGAGNMGGKIETDQDLVTVFHESISEGLRREGFTPVTYQEGTPRQLKVEIRAVEYYTSMGFWTGGLHTNAALKAVANNHGSTYENFYRAKNEIRMIFYPDSVENERQINETVSNALQQLFADRKLLEFLSE